MKPTSVTIETLPQGGEFILTLKNGKDPKKIRGRFSLYALDRFCSDRDLTFLQAIGKITLGMKLQEYADLLLYALQDYFREDFSQAGMDWDGSRISWTRETVFDYILDPMGGMGNADSLKLFKHAVGRLGAIMEDEPAAPDKKKQTGRKKNQ